jgi:hypothetical protein
LKIALILRLSLVIGPSVSLVYLIGTKLWLMFELGAGLHGFIGFETLSRRSSQDLPAVVAKPVVFPGNCIKTK